MLHALPLLRLFVPLDQENSGRLEAWARFIEYMIASIKLDNFTVFGSETIEFSDGINLIAGENGTGKSHLLKVAYATFEATWRAYRQASLLNTASTAITKAGDEASITYSLSPSREALQKALAEKLDGVFKPESIGRLCGKGRGRQSSTVSVFFKKSATPVTFSFATNSKSSVGLSTIPEEMESSGPVFIPTREVLTLYPEIISLIKNSTIQIDETYFDLAVDLAGPLSKGPRQKEVTEFVGPLEEAMKGKIRVEGSRFYLISEGKGRMEMPLVAEGVRKLAMIAYLLLNGSLGSRSTIFWDEPETNLNPKLLKEVARSLVALSEHGIQIIAATHSHFFMKEVEIQRSRQKAGKDIRFINLFFGEDDHVYQESGAALSDLDHIAALDEILSQDDRDQALFYETV